jgi:hypothetical protein
MNHSNKMPKRKTSARALRIVAAYDEMDKKRQAAREARKKAKLEQPLQTPPTNFRTDQQTFPAVYGVDGTERRRQKVISKIAGH